MADVEEYDLPKRGLGGQLVLQDKGEEDTEMPDITEERFPDIEPDDDDGRYFSQALFIICYENVYSTRAVGDGIWSNSIFYASRLHLVNSEMNCSTPHPTPLPHHQFWYHILL